MSKLIPSPVQEDVVAGIEAHITMRSFLKHPFYERWVAGTLPVPAIQDYAAQLYQFELALPSLLAGILVRLSGPEDQAVIAENLGDELGTHGGTAHAELCLRFAEAMGLTRNEVLGAAPLDATRRLISICQRLVRSRDVGAGLAALFVYERQVPEVAEVKLSALAAHYGVEGGRGVEFWQIHREVDVEHAAGEAQLLRKLTKNPAAVMRAASRTLNAWHDFLDELTPAA